VYIGIAGPDSVSVEESRYRGIREDIQRRSTQNALALLRDRLISRQ
jgi:nicotinamide mononucleotide (NMN) deamidase PncC